MPNPNSNQWRNHGANQWGNHGANQWRNHGAKGASTTLAPLYPKYKRVNVFLALTPVASGS